MTAAHPGSQPGAAPRSSPRRVSLKALRIAAAVIWALVILGLCWTPRFIIREVESGSFFRVPSADKLVHAWIFVILAILWLRIAPSRRMLLAVLVGGTALGFVSELGQLMPFVNRDANLFDFLTDVAGLLIGIAVAPLVEPLLAHLERRVFREPLAPPLPATPAAINE